MGAIYLVRHGQASFGAADYDALSETGVRQARVLGAALKRRLPRVDEVVCGTMRRHQQTAEACLAELGLPAGRRVDAGWDEYDHQEVLCAFEPRYREPAQMVADLAGAEDPRRAFQQLFSQAAARWASGAHDGDYRESWPAFRARVEAALARLAGSLGRSRTAVVFTSGGAISAVCRSLLQLPDEHTFRLSWALANASVTKVLCGARGVTLSTFNEHGHLESEPSGLLTYR
jgi:broad specificity phosphatase PhoE